LRSPWYFLDSFWQVIVDLPPQARKTAGAHYSYIWLVWTMKPAWTSLYMRWKNISPRRRDADVLWWSSWWDKQRYCGIIMIRIVLYQRSHRQSSCSVLRAATTWWMKKWAELCVERGGSFADQMTGNFLDLHAARPSSLDLHSLAPSHQ
jgi:hypothetical protein